MSVEAFLDAHYTAGLEDLKAFCRIPSVSTDPAYAEGIKAAAHFVADRLTRAGFSEVELLETGGHPAVYGEIVGDPSLPTFLVYGHYDVQPPDPLDKWKTPAFEPDERDDRLYARGVSDDKGPLLIPILVAEAFVREEGRLPVNLKVLIEGEEESGSPHFESTLEKYREKLCCDLVLSADGAMWRPDRPSITVASRGLVALDVTVTGAAKDLHSGRHGGSAPNPIAALAALLASMHGPDGRVDVDGFLNGTSPPDPRIIAAIEASEFDNEAYYREIGVPGAAPIETGRELLIRQWLEPTLEFNGISGGYQGMGTKTVIPNSASVKITCRLVAGQKPDAVVAAITRHLEKRLPKGFTLQVHRHGPGSEADFIDPDLPALKISEDVLGELLGQKPLRVAMGATIPIGSAFRKHLGCASIFFSFSTADEDYHAPNEFFRLESFRFGMKAWAMLLRRLAETPLISSQERRISQKEE
ncbi:acetylornithine deacetylase/succinyl-diaminopimelate desuccinylase-like protein [Rhizobium petrolearium]|uniref:dipeptidase n=1 Tax=Neorhizobium petrolearium TaxID=515361 RepID=UPI001AE4DA6F|nr:dipeptidase [Neorhizobium petrolearium]MBP1845553.1 acetylornithine deacetylase/succinyl-diaminopimelate desuccinylase-like protein [Neorhizobium petrolearium]